MMRREMTERINICFEGLIAVMNDLPLKASFQGMGPGAFGLGKEHKLAPHTSSSLGSLQEQVHIASYQSVPKSLHIWPKRCCKPCAKDDILLFSMPIDAPAADRPFPLLAVLIEAPLR